jgi:methylase
VRSAGLSRYITLRTMPFQQFMRAPQPAILVTNPPYGERIAADNIGELYGMIGERLKHVFMGCQAWILSYRDECFDHIGLRPKTKLQLMNGELACEYRGYELFAGTNKDYRKAQSEAPPARRFERGERPERTERNERFERRERPERSERFERADRGEHTARFSRGERPERSERSERFKRGDRPERPPRGERPERKERGERPARNTFTGKPRLSRLDLDALRRAIDKPDATAEE